MNSPLSTEPLFHLGVISISAPVVITWVIMAILWLISMLVARHLSIEPSSATPIRTKVQLALELFVETIDQQIRDTMQVEPQRYRALVGTLFLLILISNWTSLIPGIEPPTAHIETDAALSLIVFLATIFFGIRIRGIKAYLATFAEPSWAMIPLNVIEQITRNFSLIVRLFGNVMSGVFVVGIVLSLAGLLVPIPLMALDLLTGAVQAYIFTILAMVFIGAAVTDGNTPSSNNLEGKP